MRCQIHLLCNVFCLKYLQDIVSGIVGSGDGSGDGGGDGEDGDEEDPDETIHVDEKFYYIEHIVRTFAVIHSLVSLAMLIAYYHLKGTSAKFEMLQSSYLTHFLLKS